jgi:hypothetical protein
MITSPALNPGGGLGGVLLHLCFDLHHPSLSRAVYAAGVLPRRALKAERLKGTTR